MYHIQIGINISSEAKTDFIVNELIPFLEEHVKDNYYFTRSVNVIPVIDLYLNTSDIKITYIYSKIQSIFDKYLSNLSEASVQENKYYLDNQKNISRVNGYSACIPIENLTIKCEKIEAIKRDGEYNHPIDKEIYTDYGGISEYKFEKWPEFHSNSEALEFYTNKLLEISDEVYFKVYKEKGFNVVRYLIPQVSQIYDDIAYKMRWQGELNDISNLLERTDDITENELKDCIDFISNNCSSASNTIIPFFKHRFSYNSIFKYYNLYLLKFEYYIIGRTYAPLDASCKRAIVSYALA